ncbi:MAG TPA: hypothetical protein DEO70_11075 [Bacteroidales bacterium]|nr:MAG: hypothetical protein A2X11_05695 [Bacteroidetes bacterium GWE2_42_24]OFY30519.1 MAG: hypothetical protein A2X09_16675 [Bacteroidetes bacterium GWF2_43_11]HBZ67369.1 hypothetical protein [Bacteroidales bacterium]
MNETTKHLTLRINNSEFEVITEIIDLKTDYFDFERINDKSLILTFNSIDKAMELDELIKDKLVYKGFDIEFNPTYFGRICEDLIDKFYEILK